MAAAKEEGTMCSGVFGRRTDPIRFLVQQNALKLTRYGEFPIPKSAVRTFFHRIQSGTCDFGMRVPRALNRLDTGLCIC